MTTRLAQGTEWSGDQPLTSFCTNNWNKRLPIYKIVYLEIAKIRLSLPRSHGIDLYRTCSKSWKVDRPLPNHESLSHREVTCLWLFFAELVIIATGVIHCLLYNLKYKNSLAFKCEIIYFRAQHTNIILVLL